MPTQLSTQLLLYHICIPLRHFLRGLGTPFFPMRCWSFSSYRAIPNNTQGVSNGRYDDCTVARLQRCKGSVGSWAVDHYAVGIDTPPEAIGLVALSGISAVRPQLAGVRAQVGEIGVEVEVECDQLRSPISPPTENNVRRP